jgi:hypothetical protein
MMKLLGKSTAETLGRSRANLTDLAAQIAELQQRRDAALADDDGIDQIAAIDRQADEQGRRLRALQDKISLLEGRLASEQEEQRGRDFVAAVAAIEGPLARRTKAAEELERALQRVGACAKEFAAATSAVLEAWPDGVDFPARAYPGHCLSLERLGAVMQQLFTPPRGHADRRPAQPAEFVARTIDVAERVKLTGFAATERQLAEEWLADLRTAHDPVPAETENEEAA